jgi:large subunit ribosomal protein L35
MAYKFKPNKGMLKRFRVSATGKVRHSHEKSTHLRSGRSANLKRRLGRPAVLDEGHARNMRRNMGLSKLKPNRAAARRDLAARTAPAK